MSETKTTIRHELDSIYSNAATCHACGNAAVSLDWKHDRFQYGEGDDAPWIECEIPIWTCCNGCPSESGAGPLQWTDYSADIIRDAAVREAMLRGALAAQAEELREARDWITEAVRSCAERGCASRDQELRELRAQAEEHERTLKAVVEAKREAWAQTDPLTVACPYCGAVPGEFCRVMRSTSALSHSVRHAAAIRARSEEPR